MLSKLTNADQDAACRRRCVATIHQRRLFFLVFARWLSLAAIAGANSGAWGAGTVTGQRYDCHQGL
jgi:hypothetical protein